VVLRDGRIESVGPSADVEVPADAELLDAAGKLLIPGLINAHGHVGATLGLEGGHYSRDNVLRQLELYASYGVTTVVSPGGDEPLDEATVHFLGTLLGSHTVSFVVVAPRPIRDAGAGTLAEDGSRVTLSIPLADYAAHVEPRMLRVSW